MIAELVIDRSALRANARRLRDLVAPARYAAVVKSNAYGHGLVETARALEGIADALCVYRASEAFALRDSGITAPLLILGPVEPNDLDDVVSGGAALALWSDGAFRRDLARAARAAERRAAVHVKFDTGTTRLGFDPAAGTSALVSLASDPDLDLRGAYTHLAAAEELESAFTVAQLSRFERALAPVEALLREHRVVRHAAASAAAMLFPASRFDLVRAGIATYGVWPSPETRAAAGHAIELEPVLSWTTKVVVERAVEAGRSIGYGCTFSTERPSRIGVLPIGYAEGVPRSLSSAGFALAGGTRVPIVGRVCMNMTFIDLTDAPRARKGSTVTLIGADGSSRIDADEFAGWAGTIGYEILARLPAEVPRRYVEAAERTPERSVALTE